MDVVREENALGRGLSDGYLGSSRTTCGRHPYRDTLEEGTEHILLVTEAACPTRHPFPDAWALWEWMVPIGSSSCRRQNTRVSPCVLGPIPPRHRQWQKRQVEFGAVVLELDFLHASPYPPQKEPFSAHPETRIGVEGAD